MEVWNNTQVGYFHIGCVGVQEKIAEWQTHQNNIGRRSVIYLPSHNIQTSSIPSIKKNPLHKTEERLQISTQFTTDDHLSLERERIF